MKRTILFPALAIGGGGFACFLRLMQNRTGFESSSGLPVAGNLWATLLPVFLALVLAATLLLTRRIPARRGGPLSFAEAFASSSSGFLLPLTAGVFLLAISGALQLATNLGLLPDAVVLTASGLSGRSLSTGTGGLVEGALSLVCAVCLFSTIPSCRRAGSREAGKTAAYVSVEGLSLLIPVIAMVMRLVLRYRQDSVNPTLASYYIPLLALVMVTLALYLLAGFAFQSGSSRGFLLCATTAVALCITALADAQPLYSSLFYAGFALSLAGYLCLHVSRLRMI